jgi:hypothetical protein
MTILPNAHFEMIIRQNGKDLQAKLRLDVMALGEMAINNFSYVYFMRL